VQDPWEKREPGLGVGRDPWRTPLQWDGSHNAGFSHARPWLPLAPDFRERNIAALRADPRSILALYRALIELRNAHAALNVGNQRVISGADNVLWFERSFGGETFAVVLNFADEERPLPATGACDCVLSTRIDRTGPVTDTTLWANEGMILRLRPDCGA